MQTFVDSGGKEWGIRLTVSIAREIRDCLRQDILSMSPKQFSTLIETDAFFVVGCLQCFCEKQYKSQSMSDEDFIDRLDGNSIEAAKIPILMAVADFFPKRRTDYEKTHAAVRRAMLKAETESMQRIDNGILEQIVEKALTQIDTTCGVTSGEQQES